MAAFESVYLAARTHVGAVRVNNEDSIGCGDWVASNLMQAEHQSVWTPSQGSSISAVVADGIGGHRAGEVASHLVAMGLDSSRWPESDAEIPGALRQRVREVHSEIRLQSTGNPQLFGMGSTVAGVLVTAERVYCFNVGDSRVYLYEDQALRQLSVDDCAGQHPNLGRGGRSHILTQALGGRGRPELHLAHKAARAGQKYLLCSDGLSDSVGDREIAACLQSDASPVDTLLQSALDAGGHDNISIVLLELSSDPQRVSGP